jgi:curved DNA-binding protein CbpA
MRLKRNYYEVMGVPRSATAQEIKLKYHDLARQFHPDRAKDKDLAQRLFSQINIAYKVLAHESERARYDETLDAEASSAARVHPGGRVQPASPPAAAHASRQASAMAGPPPVQSRVWASPAASSASRPVGNGSAVSRPTPTGPTVARPTPTSPLGGGSVKAPAAPAQPTRYTLAQLLDLAHSAYGRGDLDQAQKICKQIITHSPDNVDALRLYGDIYVDTFRNADALIAYERALAIQPGNLTLQDKVRKLRSAAASAPSSGYSGQAPSSSRPPSGSRPQAAPAPAAKPPEKSNFFKRIIGGAR